MVPRYLIGLAVIALALAVVPAAVWAEEPKAPAEASKTLFYRTLARKPTATIEDAVRALARYKSGPEEWMNFDADLKFLKSKNVEIPKEMAARKDDPLTQGMATHMFMKALGVKGGFMYRLFPNNQRYALREAMTMGLVPGNVFVGQTLSGSEMMGLLIKIVEKRDEQEGKKAEEP